MRTPSFPVLVCLCAFALPGYATSTTVTVAQLEQFLTSTRAAKLADAEIAERLSKVDLSEELTERSLARILGESSPGPETLEQLKILAAVSVIQKPPASELPVESAPDPATQERLVSSARDYVRNALHLVPNLLAIRETRGFNNLPVDAEEKHRKPKVKMHFASEARSGIVVRGGKELDAPAEGHDDRGQFGLSSGLSSWGEFGAVLALVLSDASGETLQWHRWQRSDDSGAQMAVFGYEISRSSSHYSVSFCCYRESEDDPSEHVFKDKPAYRGEIYIDPSSGEILRITLEAELRESDPVRRSAIAVQYGHVMIGGHSYVCPVQSVAITELYNPDMQKHFGIGIERHVNEVAFTHYHKFGSTSRILTGAD